MAIHARERTKGDVREEAFGARQEEEECGLNNGFTVK